MRAASPIQSGVEPPHSKTCQETLSGYLIVRPHRGEKPMHWIFTAARRLKRLGILGMNHRNAACILDHNPRALYPLVDDKLRMRDLCVRIGVPTPEVYAEIFYHSMLGHLRDYLGDRDDFVIKPARGSAGRGVLVVMGRAGKNYIRHNGEFLPPELIKQ